MLCIPGDIWRNNQHSRDNQEGQAADLLRPRAVEMPRQSHNNRNFHDFRGLDLDKAEVDPALGAHAHFPCNFYRKQKDQGDSVADIGNGQPKAQVHKGNEA